MSSVSFKRYIAQQIAMSYLGTPYRWGGDDPEGFDCSGLTIEILKSVGILPRGGDWTADQLSKMFPETDSPKLGCLVFWNKGPDSRAIHVEMCISDDLSIGASGGGSSTLTVEDAMRQNAFVKVRPFRSRSNIALFSDPFAA